MRGKKEKAKVVWFKRDLRVSDHGPLAAVHDFEGLVIPLYLIEPDYWMHPDSSFKHWEFIRGSLVELRNNLGQLGAPLVVREGDAISVLTEIARKHQITAILAHEETGNGWTYERDLKVERWSQSQGIPLLQFPSNGVIRRLGSRNGWKAKREARMRGDVYPTPSSIGRASTLDQGEIPALPQAMKNQARAATQLGGRQAAQQTLDSFLAHRHRGYTKNISSPLGAETHSSRLSPHLAWGTISSREIIKAIDQLGRPSSETGSRVRSRDLAAFQSRLAWRCHFIQKLEDQPSLEFRCMHPSFEQVRPMDPNPESLEAWREGKTGFPLVDACMRFLAEKGWINFRMRAMVTSFASYNLWMDWRIFGPDLAKLFTDYEPGIHYSQLQMQSGVTGINTWRVYNPVKQSLDNDSEGKFIRKWVPQLAKVPMAYIHEPWNMDLTTQKETNCILGGDYPKRVVDHLDSSRKAKAKLSQVAKSSGYREMKKKVLTKHGSRRSPTTKKKPIRQNDQLELALS